MATAEVNGQTLYYELHGDPDAEPLVCVMGLGASTLSWNLQVPAWSQEHRLLIFDNRDVGQSSYASEQYGVRDMAEDALRLADHVGFDSFHLLGVSLGGAIAQEIALAEGDRMRSLTLVVTYGGSGPYAAERAALWAEEVKRTPFEEQVRKMMLLTLSQEFYENPEQVEWLLGMLLKTPHPQRPEGFGRQAMAGGAHETRDRLPSLSMPVHVIGAEWDILVPVWKSAEIAELIPGCRYSVVPRAPHGVTLERAQELNELVIAFLHEHRAEPVPAGA